MAPVRHLMGGGLGGGLGFSLDGDDLTGVDPRVDLSVGENIGAVCVDK